MIYDEPMRKTGAAVMMASLVTAGFFAAEIIIAHAQSTQSNIQGVTNPTSPAQSGNVPVVVPGYNNCGSNGQTLCNTGAAPAQNTVSQNSAPVKLFDPLQGQGFQGILTSVVNFLIVDIAIPLTSIMVLVGAFQMMTSSGDPEKYGKGRKTLLWAAIGLVVALLATSVVTLIKSVFGVS